SATSAVHPHLAHREKIYVFSELGDATHVLVDVAGVNDMQATDLKAAVERLLAEGGFGVVDAADGYILLAKGQGQADIPPDFYTFMQAKKSPDFPLDAQFGAGLRLTGYDVVDEPRWRSTRFRFYLQRVSEQPLPDDLVIAYTARDPAGAVVDDSTLRPMPATFWRPPAQWARGETVVLETVPWFLPREFAPVLTVTRGGQTVRAELAAEEPGSVPAAGNANATTPAVSTQIAQARVAPDGSLKLPGFARRDGRVEVFEGPLYTIDKADTSFAGDGWTVRLREWSAPIAIAPGQQLPVLLYWQAARAAPEDYNVFLHLRDATGKTVAMGDGQPTWFTPQPATTWQAGTDGLAGVIDAHAITVPEDLESGAYDLVVGWYDWQTGERLSCVEGAPGNPVGNEFVLGAVTVDRLAGPRPDACCLAAKECCASKE
ncbi:MAG: hypothetical protein ACM30E_04735, partial [Nitrososphaerales archaeon]